MNGLVTEAEEVFGDPWQLLLELCGLVNTREGSKHDAKEKEATHQRKHDVFSHFLRCHAWLIASL